MVGGSLRVLLLLPPLKLVAMISWNIADSDVKHNKSNQLLNIENQFSRGWISVEKYYKYMYNQIIFYYLRTFFDKCDKINYIVNSAVFGLCSFVGGMLNRVIHSSKTHVLTMKPSKWNSTPSWIYILYCDLILVGLINTCHLSMNVIWRFVFQRHIKSTDKTRVTCLLSWCS